MKKLSAYVLWGSIALVACNKTNTTEQKSAPQKLPALAQSLQHDDFGKFAGKFPTANLPTKTQTEIALGDTIPAQEVIQHILEPAQVARITAFADFYGENMENTRKGLEDRFLNQEKNVFMVLNFGYGQRFDLHPDYYTLSFQVIPTFMEGGYAYHYLANFDKAGKMIDALQVGANAGFVDMQLFKVMEITADGLIKVESKHIKRGGMEDGSADFTEFSYLHYKIGKTGNFTAEVERYTGFSGNFEGKESSDVFKIEQYPSHLQISYLPASDAFAPVELEVVRFDKDARTIIAKHPEKNLQFTLTYDADMKRVACKSSAGKVLTLSRKG